MSTVPPSGLTLMPSRDPLTSPRAAAIAAAIIVIHIAALVGLTHLRNTPEQATIVPTVFTATIIPPQPKPAPPHASPPKPAPEPPKPKVAPPPPKPRVPAPNAISQKAEPVAPPQPTAEPVKDTAPVAPPAPPTPVPAAAPPGRVEGLKLECPDPPLIYPTQSRRLGEEGVVTVRMVINTQGRVSGADIVKSSGYPRLDKAAIESAYKMRCAAPMKDGRAVETTAMKPFRFNIDN
ncbi:energy transducer TonB [Pandoraea terrigena]|uniref:Energy transducer TonB n=1 Tax=Pandoraea terrigena TaxID=2508292 RepID=A0A5E4YFE8_9BURK|nr:energy transducer TonB [Pandoraea terrigena]VVE47075.1 energy transducer TonB [Pandoraea terrigena]